MKQTCQWHKKFRNFLFVFTNNIMFCKHVGSEFLFKCTVTYLWGEHRAVLEWGDRGAGYCTV